MAPPAMTLRCTSGGRPFSRCFSIAGAPGKTVGVRIVGRPQDIVPSRYTRPGSERALDRLERDEALPAEDFARPRREAGIIHADIVEMTVHPIEPSGDPAATGLEKGDLQAGKRSHTPHMIRLVAAAIISNVCATMAAPPRVEAIIASVGCPLSATMDADARS